MFTQRFAGSFGQGCGRAIGFVLGTLWSLYTIGPRCVLFSRDYLRSNSFCGNGTARRLGNFLLSILMLLAGILAVLYVVSLIQFQESLVTSSDIPPQKLWKVRANFFSRKAGFRRHPSLMACTKQSPCHFAIVADLDTNSLVSPTFPLLFKSYSLGGRLFWDPANGTYVVHWAAQPAEILGKYNEAGRGLELSELIFFDKKLLAFDDRTGIIFEYLQNGNFIPKTIVTETKFSSKGMKIEWATVKDDTLWVGSFGKEFVDTSGNITSEANFEVALVNVYGTVKHIDWKPIYTQLRNLAGVPYPGYLIHEAVMWSRHLSKWIFIPRRANKNPYNELDDEKRGTNLILVASENFSNVKIHHIEGNLIPERGFSSFKFIPGTADRLVLALKSVEDSLAGTQETFITIFETLTGKVVLNDTRVPYAVKFEGLEFIPPDLTFPFTDTAP